MRVTTGRSNDLTTHTHFGDPGKVMPMRELCALVSGAGTTNDFYLISDRLDPRHGPLAPLLEDVRPPHAFLDDQRDGDCMILWFGPAGSQSTPLHHDTKNVLLCQVHGQKSILLFPRFEQPLLGAGPDNDLPAVRRRAP